MKTFNDILKSREMTGRALARAVDTPESYVSSLRNGLRPGVAMQRRISEALSLTPQEIEDLGWEGETANA